MERSVSVIPLTRGKFAVVDTENYEMVKGFKWHARKIGRNFYVATNEGDTTIYLHRLLVPGAELVDHLDGDGLNNQLANLRATTKQINGMNSRKRLNNKTGYIGVTRYAPATSYTAQITVGGHKHHLGVYESPFLAALAYDRALTEWAGNYGVYNFG